MGVRCSLRGSALLGAVLTLATAPFAHAEPGNLDVLFGTHGQTEVPAQVDSAAVIALRDGRILIFGVPEDPVARNEGAIAVARLLGNGEPDAAFGPGGHIDLRLGSDPLPVPTDALLLADGRILVAGYFEGAAYVQGDRLRSRARGWLVRLSPDALIDATFGVGGVARAGERGVDRIALFFDGAIAAGAPGVLHRLDSNGAPSLFPGSDTPAVPLGSSFYAISAMASMQDGAVITSAGFSGPWDDWELSRVSVSGAVVNYWGWANFTPTFGTVADLAPFGDGARVMACGTGEGLVVQRWQSDGAPDPTFAVATGGRVRLAVDARPNSWGRAPRCRRILAGSAQDHVVVGDWSNPYGLGGGRVVVAHLDVSGAVDRAFDGSGFGRELALGTSDQWSSWDVADADTTFDGAVLLIARRTSAPWPGDPYFPNELGPQRTIIARVEVSSSGGAGSIGFNDAAMRIAERQPGELRVYRSGGASGRVSLRYELLHDTADRADIVPITGTLTWVDGDASPHTITLAPVDDATLEGEERFRVRLSEATGGAGLGAPEIEVTIEDDEALRGLQFAEPIQQIKEAESANVTIAPLAVAPGPIVVHYVVAPDLDPSDGTPRPTDHTFLSMPMRVGELRWSGGDTSSRTLQVRTFGAGNIQPDETIYVALADVAGTLRQGGDWKTARITVVQDPVLGTRIAPATPVASTPGGGGGGSGGGGAISLELLPLLALALLARRRSTKPNSHRARSPLRCS